ncbi:argonaute-like protein [Mycena polygramma]|nr:argonaute-like protein [Mycena polygramma]
MQKGPLPANTVLNPCSMKLLLCANCSVLRLEAEFVCQHGGVNFPPSDFPISSSIFIHDDGQPITLNCRFSVGMHPRDRGRGRAQAPAPSDGNNPGRGAPARGRSAGRGRRGDGTRTTEGSAQPQSGRGSPSARGTDAPRRRGSSGSSRGRGESRPAGPSSRGQGSQRGRSPSVPIESAVNSLANITTANITTIGVRRREYGQAGESRNIQVNSFPATAVGKLVYQYEVGIATPDSFPSTKRPGKTLNMRLLRELQSSTRPDLFHFPAVYDGQMKLYALNELDLSDSGGEFIVLLDGMPFTLRLKRVGAVIDTSVLSKFVEGKRSSDISVFNARQALDVALRMRPLSDANLSAGKKRQIFYTALDVKELGSGIVLWRGYFQSLRPAVNRLLVNIDVSTGAMYRAGSLIEVCCEYLKSRSSAEPMAVTDLMHQLQTSEHVRQRLTRFIEDVRVEWRRIGTKEDMLVRTVKGVTRAGADQEIFTLRDGRRMSVAKYYLQTAGEPLTYPGLQCVQVGNTAAGRGALLPMELCRVVPGQPLRMGFPMPLDGARRAFSVQTPAKRLRDIEKGLQILGYGQSEYVRQFGVSVGTSPLRTVARVLEPPALKYSSVDDSGSRQELVVYPEGGMWSTWDKHTRTDRHFHQPATIESWELVSLVPKEEFTANNGKEMGRRFVNACRAAGMTVVRDTPAKIVVYLRQQHISAELDKVVRQCVQRTGREPSLVFVVLPDKNAMYESVKHWGDIQRGIPTQCIRLRHVFETKPEFWSNCVHKINMKLGGINVVVDHPGLRIPGSFPLLGDPKNATVVMGADVTHPTGALAHHPSYAAVVCSADAHAAKYVAEFRMQKGGEEMIENMEDMTRILLEAHMRIRGEKEVAKGPLYKEEDHVPKRLIFFRDGVSEDQFPIVLDKELPSIKKACGMFKVRPKITLVIVVKRHHMRFFDSKDNCQSGTVIDRDVVHPTDLDFFLQSHSSFRMRGTGRPAHYSVLYDENNLTPDQIQALSFALCHVYARSPSAVSIPAPVYYAHRVCERRGIHFDPKTVGGAPDAKQGSPFEADKDLSAFRAAFQVPHANQRDEMYFV